MDGMGRVFGGFEDVLVKFGDSGEDAINCLCEGREGTRIEMSPAVELVGSPSSALSSEAIDELRAGGWCARRRTPAVDRDSNAARFLDEFGGVKMRYKCFGSGTTDFRTFSSDIGFSPSVLRAWKSTIGQELQPIGELSASGLVLLMGVDGKVYGGVRETPELVYLIGNSELDAINRLVAGSEAIRLG